MVPENVYTHTLRELLHPVRSFLEDRNVSEIMINGPDEIFVERSGRIERTAARFSSDEALVAALRLLAQYVGRPLDAEHPILEARMPDGSRVEAVLSPIAARGTHVAIRRFSQDMLSIDRLIELGSLDRDSAWLLQALVASRQNLLVSGGTGTGKTSLLNVLSSFIPEGERVVVLEDARELQPRGEHVVRLEARPADARGKGAITIRDLFKASLRMRPDRVVVGEIRDGAALDLVQAMTSGHGGCLSTLHASYPVDALGRLETMALMADVQLPLHALRAQIASAVDIIVQVDRLRSGARVVSQISEVRGLNSAGDYILCDLYERHGTRPDHPGVLRATGILPRCARELEREGQALPPAMLKAARAREEKCA
jgi:pilus assembly protein CpaF